MNTFLTKYLLLSYYMFFFLAGGRKVEKLRLFFKAHDLKKLGFSIEKISRKLGISRNTVYKHLNMFYEEGVKWTTKNWNRAKILDPYEKHILSWLKEHPDLSSAQIEDWLKRHFPELKVGNSVFGKQKMNETAIKNVVTCQFID